MKRCSKCGQLKPLEEFGKDKKKKDGHRSSCKSCFKLRWEELGSKHHSAQDQREWRHRIKIEKYGINKCSVCGVSIEGKTLNARYCDLHRIKHNEFLTAKKQRLDALLLNDQYIKKLLIEHDGFTREMINNDIIETKRQILKIKRLCKTLKN